MGTCATIAMEMCGVTPFRYLLICAWVSGHLDFPESVWKERNDTETLLTCLYCLSLIHI